MKLVNQTWLACLMILSGPFAHAQTQISKTWVPAVYHNLVVGNSTRDEALKILGKPNSTGKEQDTGIPTMTYKVSDPVAGTLVVYVKKGILDGMSLYPDRELRRSDVVRLLGPNYAVVHYATDHCLTEGGTAPIFESPGGPILHIEYRARGLAVILNGNQVAAIAFVARAFGPTRSLCAGRQEKEEKR